MYELQQERIKFSTGYVEVKPNKSCSDTVKTYEDHFFIYLRNCTPLMFYNPSLDFHRS